MESIKLKCVATGGVRSPIVTVQFPPPSQPVKMAAVIANKLAASTCIKGAALNARNNRVAAVTNNHRVVTEAKIKV